jgi:hypothetical protein
MSITEQIHEAEAEYRHMQAIEHQRKAAEAAYVLARLYQEAGDTEMSKQYASLAGVQLPNLIHEGVVRQAFHL